MPNLTKKCGTCGLAAWDCTCPLAERVLPEAPGDPGCPKGHSAERWGRRLQDGSGKTFCALCGARYESPA